MSQERSHLHQEQTHTYEEERNAKKEGDLVDSDTLATELICTNDNKKPKTEVEKTVGLNATESKADKEGGLKSIMGGGNGEHEDLEREVNEANNVDNTGRSNHKAKDKDKDLESKVNHGNNVNSMDTSNDKTKETREKREEIDNCKKKTDHGRKKEKEKRKEKCGTDDGKELTEKRKESGREKDKVRIKRVEVTSKKSILV